MAVEEPSRNVPFILDMPFYRGLKPIDLGAGMKSHEAQQTLPDVIFPALDCQFLLIFHRLLSKQSDQPAPQLALPSSKALQWDISELVPN